MTEYFIDFFYIADKSNYEIDQMISDPIRILASLAQPEGCPFFPKCLTAAAVPAWAPEPESRRATRHAQA